MPTMPHEGLVKLFENQPELAPELLRDALGVDLPPYQEARISSESLNHLDVVERTADLVILLVVGKAVLAIVVEAQLRVKPNKLDPHRR